METKIEVPDSTAAYDSEEEQPLSDSDDDSLELLELAMKNPDVRLKQLYEDFIETNSEEYFPSSSRFNEEGIGKLSGCFKLAQSIGTDAVEALTLDSFKIRELHPPHSLIPIFLENCKECDVEFKRILLDQIIRKWGTNIPYFDHLVPQHANFMGKLFIELYPIAHEREEAMLQASFYLKSSMVETLSERVQYSKQTDSLKRLEAFVKAAGGDNKPRPVLPIPKLFNTEEKPSQEIFAEPIANSELHDNFMKATELLQKRSESDEYQQGISMLKFCFTLARSIDGNSLKQLIFSILNLKNFTEKNGPVLLLKDNDFTQWEPELKDYLFKEILSKWGAHQHPRLIGNFMAECYPGISTKKQAMAISIASRSAGKDSAGKNNYLHPEAVRAAEKKIKKSLNNAISSNFTSFFNEHKIPKTVSTIIFDFWRDRFPKLR
jgi:hypothetical protein